MDAPTPTIPAAELHYDYEPTHIPRELIALLCDEDFNTDTLAIGAEMEYEECYAIWEEYKEAEDEGEYWQPDCIMGAVADYDNDGIDDLVLAAFSGTATCVYPLIFRIESGQRVKMPTQKGESYGGGCTVISYQEKNYIYRPTIDRAGSKMVEGFFLSYYENGAELEILFVDCMITGICG